MKAAALLAAVAALATLTTSGHDAEACGGFFARGPDVPALEVEQTLIVHDPVKQMEHFIREVTFRKGNVTFGFVVPTPSRPTVAKVDDAPFKRLRDAFPFRTPRNGIGFGAGGGGVGSKGGGSGVEVLSQQKLGSFTAFVLAATDAGGLTRWLADNHFETTPASAKWLEHYVALKFYYVAFRFDPPRSDGGAPNEASAVSSETMRISFPTPLPFYPYLEPEHPAPGTGPRVLDVWLVAPSASTPVAAVREAKSGDAFHWKRPWLEGGSGRSDVETVKKALGPSLAALLPPARRPAAGEEADGPSYSVQVFEDQKTRRDGFGDVVFVPEEAVTLTEAELAKRRAFFDVLDPTRGAR